MSSEIRIPGYYWVKTSGRWQIALWEADAWALHGVEESFFDHEFDQIGKRPIATLSNLNIKDKDLLKEVLPQKTKGQRRRKQN